jgi:hypothetical protein
VLDRGREPAAGGHLQDGPTEFKKHFLGLSDNFSYFTEQLEPATVDTWHYKVIFKPEVIVPDVDRPS